MLRSFLGKSGSAARQEAKYTSYDDLEGGGDGAGCELPRRAAPDVIGKPAAKTSDDSEMSTQASSNSGGSAGGACAAAEESVLITVVRSNIWTGGGDDETWRLEMPAADTIADLKEALEDAYGVPEQLQHLQRTGRRGERALHDSMPLAELPRRPIYLLPDPRATRRTDASDEVDDNEEESESEDELEAAMHEREEAARAMEASLKGVTYRIRFVRPAAPGSGGRSREVFLDVSALALVGDVQPMVEIELFGSVGQELACLTFNGRLLPPNIPIHFAGIGSGDVVVVGTDVPEPEADSDEDSLAAGMLAWAASD